MRQLVKFVSIDKITAIPGAEFIEVAHVGGWAVVTKRGEFSEGAQALYFEIDSFLPEGHPAWQFLVDKSSREYGDKRGHVLRTVKFRGQVSQGFLLPVAAVPEIDGLSDAVDLAEVLGVVKYEKPIPACLAGEARGVFPSRVPKTDQERVQNLAQKLEQWVAEGTEWEVSEKLEGSSCTAGIIDGEFRVCSRNLDLRETAGNTFWQAVRACEVEERLRKHFPERELALQGELVGPGVEGNIYKLIKAAYYVYDVYDVNQSRYLTPAERMTVLSKLNEADNWADLPMAEQQQAAKSWVIKHVPTLGFMRLPSGAAMAGLLALADGQSLLAKTAREGLVFKAVNGGASFKAISNKYLLKQD